MNELTKYLIESILIEDVSQKVVVYAGRFQPFHKGHYATYQHLVKKFGKDNVYIGTSNKTDNQKSPFGFSEKKYIMSRMFGIPANKIVLIKNPYAPVEILDKFKNDSTAFITAVGEKDEMRLGGKYFEKYSDGKKLDGYLDKGYVYISPSQSNPISGTDVRNWLGKGDDESRKDGFMKAYPKFDEKVFKLITLTLNKITKEGLMETSLGGYGADEGEPAPMYIPDGSKRILNKQKPEPWFKQLGYTQMDKPKADSMRGKGKSKDTDSQFRKVYYKVSNINQSDLNPVEKPKGPDAWKKIKEDVIAGGLAKGMTLSDVAEKHGVSIDILVSEFKKGIKVEMEHTTDREVAKEIALDHLFENPNYYTNLAKVEMAKSDLDQVEKYADSQLSPEDVELGKETDHFFQRLNDPRNGKEISAPELTGFFKRLSKHKKQFIEFLKQYKEFVVLDKRTNINIPFMKVANKLIAKTIMRKADFKSSTPIFVSEGPTKGLYAGTIKIGGQPVKVEVELYGADDKTKSFLTKVVHIDSKYFKQLPIGSTLPIPARIFRTPGGGWYKIKHKAFESLNEVQWEDSTYDKCMLGKLPLSLSIVKQLVEPIRTTSLHATDVEHLPQVASLQGKQKSISTFTHTTKYGKLVQGKGMHTKGGIIVALSGIVLAQSIMDLWTEPDKRGMRWVNPGTIIAGLGREQDVVFNFAPELKPYKEEWKKNMYDKPATNKEKYEFIQKYIAAAYKYMLSKKKEFQDKYLNSNGLYYDSDWNEVVLTQIKIEGILVVPSLLKVKTQVGSWTFDREDKDETEKIIKQLKQKYPNVVVANNETDIQNFIKNNGGTIKEDINLDVNVGDTLLMEGGAYGHMNHPFDIQMNLTFGDLKKIVKQALSGKLELAREKTDGQAIAISWVNGRLVAARNKSHLKNKGKDAMSVQDVISKFAGRGSVSDAFSFAIKDLESAIKGLSDASKKKIFKDGKCFMNCEIIYPENTNVIPYGQSLLVFHGTMEYDIDGNAIGQNAETGNQLATMVKKVNADVQSKFKLQGPPIQKLPVNKDLKAKQSIFLSKIQTLQSEFGLTDKSGVADYHQAWWLNFINKNTKGLDEQHKIGLVKRWAFGDKGFRIKDIKDDKNREWADKIEKQDQQKITKENLLKFETIFLGVGAEVLSFMTSVLTVNPDAAKQQMVGRLQTAIDSIKATGDAKNLDKLNIELARIEALGGFDKIVPNEGIVFNYKGNTFKLTGAFAPLNQILGIFTFSR